MHNVDSASEVLQAASYTPSENPNAILTLFVGKTHSMWVKSVQATE